MSCDRRSCTYLLLPVVELPTREVGVPQVRFGLDTSLFQILHELFTRIVDLRLVTLVDTTRDDDRLDARNARREDQPLVITMHHDHYADHTSRKSPAVLPSKELVPAIVWILDFDAKHLGEVLPEAVGGGALDTSSSSWDKSLDGGGV